MGVNAKAVLYRRYIEMTKLLNIYLNHFPRDERYALSNRIRNTAYEVYDCITEAQKKHFKKSPLSNLDVTHERLRMQVFLAYELGYFSFKDGKRNDKVDESHRYMALSQKIDEIGKIIGAWINSEKAKGNM